MEDKALTTRVILVRHGESTYNVQRIVQGHCDESFLTPLGQTMAQQTGAALQDVLLNAAYSSPLKRAKETADIILSNRSDLRFPLLSDDLKEVNLVLWEGMSFQDVEGKFPDQFLCWRDRPHELCMQIPGETGIQDFYPVPALYEQAKRFWQNVLPQHPDETILVVAHSGIIRALLGTAVGLPPANYHSFHISNCGISVLNFAGSLGEPVQMESVNLTAHVDQPLPKYRNGQRGLRLLLVRHGETDWNRQKRFQGQIDVPLNAQGQIQAQQASEFLGATPIDRALSSPLLRPKRTAEVILQQHPDVELEFLTDLQEISHGLWEGKLEAEIEQAYPGLLAEWQQSPQSVQMPDGENLQQVWDRTIAAWNSIVASTVERNDRPTIVLVSAHDAVNKAILCSLVGWHPDHFWTFKQGNGAVSVIDYPQGASGKAIVFAMNITTHLGGVIDRTAAGAL